MTTLTASHQLHYQDINSCYREQGLKRWRPELPCPVSNNRYVEVISFAMIPLHPQCQKHCPGDSHGAPPTDSNL